MTTIVNGGPVIVYTDGACSGNPGPGGWAWFVPAVKMHGGGFTPATTNQRMELKAVLEAVNSFDGPLEIRSDSTYVVNCFKLEWWRKWEANGWRNSQGKEVANQDLWKPLIEQFKQKTITFVWVKGHASDQGNNTVDELARMYCDLGR